MKIIGIYKITNTITGDFYIGSSKDVKRRWNEHKFPSRWNRYSNSQLYKDMQKYGLDKFELQILEEVEPCSLKEKEQQYIERLKPTYNQMNAKGRDFERRKKKKKEYYKAHKDKRKEYDNQLCCYNGEVLKLCALYTRFRRAGIAHPVLEAKKYLIKDK